MTAGPQPLPPPVLWDLVLPVKRLRFAKTRLHVSPSAASLFGTSPPEAGHPPAVGSPPVPGGPHGVGDSLATDRERLALSFAVDAVDAARTATRVGRILVVTEDPLVAGVLASRGAVIVREARGPGLNPAVEAGIDAALAGDPQRRVAVMTADLPAVTGAEIDAALASAQSHRRAVLADAEGTGTVLLTADPFAPVPADPFVSLPGDTDTTAARDARAASDDRPASAPVRPRPRFGEGSFGRHVAAGHTPLTGAHPGLRRDVDTGDDLETARLLGLGDTTGSALDPQRISPRSSETRPGPRQPWPCLRPARPRT